MRTTTAFLLTGLLIALPAAAQTSGGGTSGSGAGAAASGTTTGASPSSGGVTTQPGTAVSPGGDGRTTGTSPTGLRSPNANEIANPSGAQSVPAPVGSGSAPRAASRNCDAAAKDCETPLTGRYMRLVDSMARMACGRCASK
jgi:hypothetical protein